MIDGLVPNGELTKKADEVEAKAAQLRPTVALCPFCTTGTLVLELGFGNQVPLIVCQNQNCEKTWRPV